MNKKKIVVVGAKGFPAWGGAARANESIFTRLTDKLDVTIYALSSHAEKKEYEGIKQVIFKASRNKKISTFLYYLKSLFHALFLASYDIVHVNHLAAGYIIPFLRLRYPVVLNVRGMNYHGDNKWNWMEKQIFNFFQWIGVRSANLVLTVERGSVDILKAIGNSSVTFIPNGIDNKIFSYLNVIDLQKKEYDITFSAARIISLKGLHVLLDALHKIQFKGRVQIIGDLNQVISYKTIILEKAAGLDCDFVGLVKNREELFQKVLKSKIFVFPSFSEGMSNMLLEVASLKIPIIASNISQNIDVFSPEEVLFFDIQDTNDLANKILYALSNEKLMAERAERAYQHLKEEYDWDAIALQYLQAYQKLIEN